ncbi:MAG: trypsin-like peptidase domain-containing protein [Phycisphaerae bacterium]|nr:trypsin-like peptidase domain-containing protein [Phycisphaerae bacterium]
MSDREVRRAPTLLQQFLLLLAVTFVVLVGSVRLGLVEWWAYSMERGRIQAMRESFKEFSPTESDAILRENVIATVIPAVVSVEADLELHAKESTSAPSQSRDGLVGPPAPPESEREFDGDRGWGSGFIIDADGGYVLTNAHVVYGASGVRVHTADDRKLAAQVVGIDTETDLAVVQIPSEKLHQIPLGDSERVAVGEEVLAVGSPFGLDRTVTQGIISALNRRGIRGETERYARLIQTDAAISPGSSGGPLVNLRGEVIGINTAIISPGGRFQGVGFAIPSAIAAGMIPDLISGGPAFLGVLVWNATDPAGREEVRSLGWTEDYGAVVDEVYANTGAAEAGLRVDDILLSLDGERINSIEQLGEMVQRRKPGEAVDLTILRDHAEQVVTLELSRRYAPR